MLKVACCEVDPNANGVKITGGKLLFNILSLFADPKNELYLVVDLIELRDGLVHRETVYWAAPFEAPTSDDVFKLKRCRIASRYSRNVTIDDTKMA